MKCSLSKYELMEYVKKQLNFFFPDGKLYFDKNVESAMDFALQRCEYCFKHILVKGYSDKGSAFFYHLNSDQYAQFLWYFANSLWKYDCNKDICDKLILLNKLLNGVWISYKNNLPDIFLLTHPVGTVLGNAQYSDYLVVSQNVTVNTSSKLKIGRGCFIAAGAKIIGDEEIGDNVSIGVDTCVYKKSIPKNHLVYRDSDGTMKFISRDKSNAYIYFNVDLGDNL